MMNRLHLNENVYGPIKVSSNFFGNIKLGEYGDNKKLILKLAQKECVTEDSIFLGTGIENLLLWVLDCIGEQQGYVSIPEITWEYYKNIIERSGKKWITFGMKKANESFVYDYNEMEKIIIEYNPEIFIIGSPNNPTGNSIDIAKMINVCKKYKNIIFVIDECYRGFSTNKEIKYNEVYSECDNIIFLETFSKYYALPAIRVGYAILSYKLKTMLYKYSNRWGISKVDEALAIMALENPQYYKDISNKICKTRSKFVNEMIENGIDAYISDGNFIYVQILNADYLAKELKIHGYQVKVCSQDALRITIGSEECMDDIVALITGWRKNGKL